LMVHSSVGTWGTPGRRAAVSRSTSEVTGWAKQTKEIRTSNQAREVVELAVNPTPVPARDEVFRVDMGVSNFSAAVATPCRRASVVHHPAHSAPLRSRGQRNILIEPLTPRTCSERSLLAAILSMFQETLPGTLQCRFRSIEPNRNEA
jgi:hypothetical protein